MKIRTGFVSNSSSSSFICGIAEIADKAKFDAYIARHKIALDDYDLCVVTQESDNYDVRRNGEFLTVENFCTDTRAKLNKPGTMYFVVNISNNEGDGDFWNEEWGDMDYDIDIDFFSKDQQQVYAMFSDAESGLKLDNQDVTYGAARNG